MSAIQAAEAFADGELDDAARSKAETAAKQALGGYQVFTVFRPNATLTVGLLQFELYVEANMGVIGDVAQFYGGGATTRCVFGNPFRPVTFAAEWRTSTAVALASGMYESRDFSAMPILADALQDAGCDNPDVLEHCRDPNATHVRGCWVVDLVLGKS